MFELISFALLLLTFLNFFFGQSRLWKFLHGLVAVFVGLQSMHGDIHIIANFWAINDLVKNQNDTEFYYQSYRHSFQKTLEKKVYYWI